MAIADYATLERMILSPREWIGFIKNTPATLVSGRPASLWTTNPLGAAIPTTAAVPARDITGAIAQTNGGGNALRVAGMQISAPLQSTWILCDRLSHQGGLDGTVTTAQTTNLPTAALTRYTTGVGVFAALEIYTTVGTTATTVTMSYTDNDNNAAQTSPAMVLGGTGSREAGRMVVLPVASGDTGVRAVASVTVLATTGTAGNFGVTLFKPLLYIPVNTGDSFLADPILGTMGGGIPEIVDDACLFWMFLNPNPTSVAASSTEFTVSFSED